MKLFVVANKECDIALNRLGKGIDNVTVDSNTSNIEAIKPDAVLFLSAGYGKIAEKLRKEGAIVIGSSFMSDELMTNLRFRDEILKIAGLELFDGNQEGIRLYTGLWFSHGKPIYPPLFELDGVVRAYNVKQPRIVQKLFRRLYIMLEKIKYNGIIGIEYIVNKEGNAYIIRFNNSIARIYNQLNDILKINNFIELNVKNGLDQLPVSNDLSYRLPSISLTFKDIKDITLPRSIPENIQSKYRKLKELRYI